MRSRGVVVSDEAVELGLELGQGEGRIWRARNFFSVWWNRSALPQVWGWFGLLCLKVTCNRSSSYSRSTRPRRYFPG